MQDKEEIEIVDVHIITPVNLAALKKTAEAGDRGCQTALKLADEFIEFMGGSERYCMAGCSNDVAFNIDNGNPPAAIVVVLESGDAKVAGLCCDCVRGRDCMDVINEQLGKIGIKAATVQ